MSFRLYDGAEKIVTEAGVIVSAKLYPPVKGPGRQAERWPVEIGSTLRGTAADPMDVVIHDISVLGFRVGTTADLDQGSEVRIGLPGIGVRDATVIHRDGTQYGCSFAVPLEPYDMDEMMSAETVVYGRFDRARVPQPMRGSTPVWATMGLTIGLSLAFWLVVALSTRAMFV